MHVPEKESKEGSTNTLLLGLLGVNSLVVVAAGIYIVKCMRKRYRMYKTRVTTFNQTNNDERIYQTEEMNMAYQEIHNYQYTIPGTIDVPVERHDVVKIEREPQNIRVDIEDSSDYLTPVVHPSQSDGQ
jgi:hypothetical protein